MFRYLLGITLALCVTLIAKADDASSNPPTQTEINTNAVVAYVTAYAAKDFDGMAPFLAEDAVFSDPANHFEGKEQIISSMQANSGKASDTGIAPEEILKLRSGNTYLMASRIDFNLMMAPGGAEAREFHFNLNFVIKLEVEDGLIVRHDDYVDSDAFGAQMMAQMIE